MTDYQALAYPINKGFILKLGGKMLYFDSYYFMLVVPMMLLAMLAQWHVKSTLDKYSRTSNYRGLSGAQVAQMILQENGIYDVGVEGVGGNFTDHYDPADKMVRLSEAVYGSRSLAAVGVAAHETGHAIQHARAYKPLVIRTMAYPLANIGSQVGVPLAIFGLIFSWPFLTHLGIVLYGVAVIFYLITLPVEINASSRALACLGQDRILDMREIEGAKKVLTAAALTYVAAAGVAIANLARLILLSRRRRRN